MGIVVFVLLKDKKGAVLHTVYTMLEIRLDGLNHVNVKITIFTTA